MDGLRNGYKSSSALPGGACRSWGCAWGVCVALIAIVAGVRAAHCEPAGDPAAVIISEFMAANTATLADEDGDYTDWIELFNTSYSATSIEGCYLTDDPDDLDSILEQIEAARAGS